jgi:hypothetical protein
MSGVARDGIVRCKKFHEGSRSDRKSGIDEVVWAKTGRGVIGTPNVKGHARAC